MDFVRHSLTFLILLVSVGLSVYLALKRKVSRKGLLCFVTVGFLLSVTRIIIFVDLSFQSINGKYAFWAEYTGLVLLPDSFLFRYIPDIDSKIIYIVASSILLVGSYLWALPFLFVNSKRKVK
jgi:hypothetical protein